jgi:PAS domain S-box-containing protein
VASIKILHLEDLPFDAELVERELKKRKIDFELKVIDNRRDFVKALTEFSPDVIFSDHKLIDFDSIQALKIVLEKGLQIPFILVTATMSEEFAVEVIMLGASDYILKDRLQRLPGALLSAIEKNKAELENQRIHRLLEENEKRFRSLIEKGMDMIMLSSWDGELIYASPSVFTILGYSKQDILKTLLYDYIHPDDKEGFMSSIFKILQSPGSSLFRNHRYLHKKGTWVWAEGTITNMLAEPGVNALVSNFRDISEKKIIDRQREFDRRNLHALINNTSDQMWSVDRKLNLVTANQTFLAMAERFFGKPFLIGANVQDLNYPEDILKSYRQYYKRALKGEIFTEVIYSPKPTELWTEVSFNPIYEGQMVIGIACHSREITNLKIAERKIRTSEIFTRGILNNLTSQIAVSDSIGNILAVNEAWLQFGINNGTKDISRAGVGANYFDECKLSAQRGDESALDILQQLKLLVNGEVENVYLEYPCHSPTENRWFALRATRFNSEEDMIVISHENITNSKVSEQNLLETRTLLTEAQDLALIGSWNFNAINNEMVWSDSLYRIMGVADDYPTTVQSSFALLYPMDYPIIIEKLKQLRFAGVDGSLEITYRIVRPDSKEIRYMNGKAHVERGADGQLVRMFGIAQDITELKKAEEDRDKTLMELEQRVEDRTREVILRNNNITDSINYAKRIQLSLLSHEDKLKDLFPKSFLLSMPRDIVSGDFFWCHQRRNKKFVVVADCTGHGVPGAFMSLIGNNLLNQIVVNEHIENPSEILEQLDYRMTKMVNQNSDEVPDGMDVALCVIESGYNELYFCGAFRPLFMAGDDGRVIEVKPTRNSIGGNRMEGRKNFETRRFPIYPGQKIYLCSDGYYSQFGGPSNSKLMKATFLEELGKQNTIPISEQGAALKTHIQNWMGVHQQIDDIMVVGIEF